MKIVDREGQPVIEIECQAESIVFTGDSDIVTLQPIGKDAGVGRLVIELKDALRGKFRNGVKYTIGVPVPVEAMQVATQ